MHDPDADLVEHVGASPKGERAEPARKRHDGPGRRDAHTAPAKVSGLAEEMAVPAPRVEHAARDDVPSVAVYVKPAPGESHPSIARLAPALRLDEAAAALNSATAELTAARTALRSAEVAEGNALSAFMASMPKQSPDDLLREHVANEQRQRAERVEAGLPPGGDKPPQHSRSPIDVAAAQRPRQSRLRPSTPLRSPVTRHGVD